MDVEDQLEIMFMFLTNDRFVAAPKDVPDIEKVGLLY